MYCIFSGLISTQASSAFSCIYLRSAQMRLDVSMLFSSIKGKCAALAAHFLVCYIRRLAPGPMGIPRPNQIAATIDHTIRNAIEYGRSVAT